jgi:REP element-mobilizing transposase RayT
MTRIAHIVVPGTLHHVTWRGNRRQPMFMEKGDYALYGDLLAEHCACNAFFKLRAPVMGICFRRRRHFRRGAKGGRDA